MNRLIFVAVLLLSGCDDGSISIVDQCMRIKLTQQCMKDIPKPPTATHFSDWDEVIQQCDTNSYYQSLRKKEFVKEECRT